MPVTSIRSFPSRREAGGAVPWGAALLVLVVCAFSVGGCACSRKDRAPNPGGARAVQGQPRPVSDRAIGCDRGVPTPAGSGSESSGAAVASTSISALVPSRRLVWDFPEAPLGELRVIVAVPPHDPKSGPLPVLIALHGKGEALKGPLRGARGWLDDYELDKAAEALARGAPTIDDYRGFATVERLAEVRAELSSQPYRGMVVVMPYTPLELAGNKPFSAVLPYGRFLVESVLPRVHRETPAAPLASSTGIDGVSLGGRVALLLGLSFPSSFGVVGSLQAALDSEEAAELVALARSARRENPALKLRLLTSDGDFFLEPIRTISTAWRAAGIDHELLVVPGPHDYAFNRGPGAIEMLLYHDRALRLGERAPRPAGTGT